LIVEVRRIVAAILVDDKGVGEGAEFQKTVPVRRVAGEPRCLQREDRPRLPHGDIGHEGLEVVPPRHLGSRYPEVPIEYQDILPAELPRLRLERILALGALLMVTDLCHRRLAYVDVRRLL